MDNLAELKDFAEDAGVTVIGQIVQKRAGIVPVHTSEPVK